MKKKNKPEKCKSQFARTVKKTGKWRGKKATEYKKFKSGTKKKIKLFRQK